MLLREITVSNPFKHPFGSPERGAVWSYIHRQNYVLTVLVNRKRRLESCSRQIREVEAKEAGD